MIETDIKVVDTKLMPHAMFLGHPENYKLDIYVASKAYHAPMWRRHREALKSSGINIIARWIDVDENVAGFSFQKLWDDCLEDVMRSDAMILFQAPGDVLTGALVETGAALTHDIPVHWTGHDVALRSFTNHRLMHQHDDLDAVFAYLKSIIRRGM